MLIDHLHHPKCLWDQFGLFNSYMNHASHMSMAMMTFTGHVSCMGKIS